MKNIHQKLEITSLKKNTKNIFKIIKETMMTLKKKKG